MKFKPLTVGVYTGLFFAMLHAIWALLVYSKLAKTYLDFILGLHMVSNPYKILDFSLSTAVTLLVVVFLVGLVVGYVGTIIWNLMQKRR